MSNQKQFTVTHKMLTAVERAVEGSLMLSQEGAFFKICFSFVLLYNKSLDDWSGNSEFYFPRISMFPLTSSWETLRFLGKKNYSLLPSGPVIKC